jgi:hypothetical protein
LLGSYRLDRHDAAVERLLAGFWIDAAEVEPLKAPRGNGNGHG